MWTAVGVDAVAPAFFVTRPKTMGLPALKQELDREPVKLPTAQRLTSDGLVLFRFSIEGF